MALGGKNLFLQLIHSTVEKRRSFFGNVISLIISTVENILDFSSNYILMNRS